MAQIALIGAGLTGLTTAYYLEQAGYSDYVLYERNAQPGGLCRSVRHNGFTFDYTGHLLHTAHPLMQTLITQLLPESMHAIKRQSAVYSQNTFTPYPYQTHLHGLPADTIIDCIKGFVERPHTQKKHSLHDWLLTHFGAGFVHHFFKPYQEKMMGCTLDQQTDCWAQQFIPPTSLEAIVRGSLSAECPQNEGYHAHFWYPRTGGIDQLIDALTNTIKHKPLLEHSVEHIDTRRKKIYFSSGHCHSYDILISTMPLNQLLASLIPSSENHWASHAATRLHARSVINVNVELSGVVPQKMHWLYVPETVHLFYRIGFPSELSVHMAPAGCSSLALEIACNPEERAQFSNEKAIEQALALLHIPYSAYQAHVTLPLECAYVRYDAWRRTSLARILQKLASLDIYSIGRYGAWKYASMHDSCIDSHQLVHDILNTKLNLPKKAVP